MNWENCYQRNEIPWDLGEAAPPLMEILEGRPLEIWGEGSILVPGCGRGHDAAALWRSGRGVLALDLAPRALREAERLYGRPKGLQWLEGSFFDLDLAAAHRVGAIFEHTCFCAIPPSERKAYVEAAAHWLEPGGRLVAVFYLDPPRRDDGVAGPPYGATRREIRKLFKSRFRIARETEPKRTHPEREGREWVVEMVRTD
ncbi:MAG: methyltransferase domain-containing protein [Akkermansiaceae bacterium]|nr:methyltransferase domain-containing protein [Akkermansiaceae bacterium]